MAKEDNVICDMLEDLAKGKKNIGGFSESQVIAISILELKSDVNSLKKKIDRIERYIYFLIFTVVASGMINLIFK